MLGAGGVFARAAFARRALRGALWTWGTQSRAPRVSGLPLERPHGSGSAAHRCRARVEYGSDERDCSGGAAWYGDCNLPLAWCGDWRLRSVWSLWVSSCRVATVARRASSALASAMATCRWCAWNRTMAATTGKNDRIARCSPLCVARANARSCVRG